MSIQFKTFSMKLLLSFISVASSVLILTGCGGSGVDSDDSEPTVRPKTLDGLIIKLDSTVSFEFVRTSGTSAALVSGDIETGTFFYSLSGNQLRTYSNTSGDNSDCRFPDSISGASYTYQAINETSALLTLTGTGINDLDDTGSYGAQNNSFCFFFNSDSDGNVITQVEIDLAFQSNGSTIDPGTSTVRIPGSTSPEFDIVRIDTSIQMSTGASVAENYNPSIDYLRDSLIAPETLNNVVMNFTNGIPDPTLDFTIQFVTQSSSYDLDYEYDEIGQGFLRIASSPVTDAVDYTWMRIAGTDDGTLIISGSNTTLDGQYTLSFVGVDNGTYVGEVDSDTDDIGEVSGTIFLPGTST